MLGRGFCGHNLPGPRSRPPHELEMCVCVCVRGLAPAVGPRVGWAPRAGGVQGVAWRALVTHAWQCSLNLLCTSVVHENLLCTAEGADWTFLRWLPW